MDTNSEPIVQSFRKAKELFNLQIIVRPAYAEDVIDLCEIAELFVNESGLGFTFNYDKTYDLLLNIILNNKNAVILIAADSESVKGVAIFNFESTFYNEEVAYLHTFYVRPEARGTVAARMLVDSMCKIVDNVGAKHIYVSSTAAISSKVDKLFGNLFKKFGFKELGSIFVKEFN